jgi:hypothetical protein
MYNLVFFNSQVAISFHASTKSSREAEKGQCAGKNKKDPGKTQVSSQGSRN